jgi:hypothetical protein
MKDKLSYFIVIKINNTKLINFLFTHKIIIILEFIIKVPTIFIEIVLKFQEILKMRDKL